MVRKLQLQNKAITMINLKSIDHPPDALHHSNKILKIIDFIKLLNYMFVKNLLARHCLSNFQGTFRLAIIIHQHNHNSDPSFLNRGDVNFNSLPWRGESEKLKREWNYGARGSLFEKGGWATTFPI